MCIVAFVVITFLISIIAYYCISRYPRITIIRRSR
jgi:hypothetical protein